MIFPSHQEGRLREAKVLSLCFSFFLSFLSSFLLSFTIFLHLFYSIGFPTYIYARPTISASQFVTYNNYFVFKNKSVTSEYDGLVLSYRPKGKKNWISGNPSKPSGWFSSYETGKMNGLKANTFYEVRASYTKNVGGKTYSSIYPSWGSNLAYSNTITIKTGPAKKPPIKSIKITKAKVKTSRTKGKWYWDNGHLKYLKPYKVYRTTFTVTVTMKKKPGVKGIYIGEKKVKGNKKKYKTKFTIDGKMKGKKVRVDVRTYGNNTYGQRSMVYSKKVKVKK